MPPAGAHVEELLTSDRVRLRAAFWEAKGAARGTVALFGGRAEFIEKHFETIGDLVDRGFAVATLDWRGQGGSQRPLGNPMKHHVRDFSLYERDLTALVEEILTPICPKPWHALAHSMGAAILLSIAHAGRLPFSRMVLTSPMIAIAGVHRPRLIRFALDGLGAIGLGGAFVPGRGERSALERSFEGNPLTSDRWRFERAAATLVVEPSVGVGLPTIGWTRAAMRLMRRFEDPYYPREILTPTLVIAAGADSVTDTAACEHFAARLRAGQLIVLEGARHEILMERDLHRDLFWAAFDAFIPGSEP